MRNYAITVACEATCEKDEAFVVSDFRPLTKTNIDAVLHLCAVELPHWDGAVGAPLVGTVQATLSKLVGVLPFIEGITPEDQSLATYLTIGTVVLIRDAILAHGYAATRVSVEATEIVETPTFTDDANGPVELTTPVPADVEDEEVRRVF